MFNETQKFSQLWILILLSVTGLIMITLFGFGIYKQIIQGQQFGNNPMSNNGLIFTFIACALLFVGIFTLILSARLTTIIDENGISYKFSPFHFSFRNISWNSIEKHEVIKYKPIGDYGGWGIRINKYGRAFNVSGNKGLQLYLKNGKRILIGTQKEKELTDFLANLRNLNV